MSGKKKLRPYRRREEPSFAKATPEAESEVDMGNSDMVEDSGIEAASGSDKPAPPQQSSSDWDTIYAQAAEALVTLGAQTVKIASETKGKPLVPTELKDRVKAREKADRDYKGKPERLVDIARVSLIYDTDESMQEGVSAVKKDFTVVREKNNFKNPKGGYRDYNFNVNVGGHICEVQVHLTAIIEAKKEGHDAYEITRRLQGKLDNGEPLDAEDMKLLKDKTAEMWKLYNDAYAGAGGDVTEEQRSFEPKAPEVPE